MAYECLKTPLSTPLRLPDKNDKVITAYICIAEVSMVDWEASINPAWDADDDMRIDANAGPIPDYIDLDVYNEDWKGYRVKYWTESWRDEIRRKIDLAAAQHFDGVFLDYMNLADGWYHADPSMSREELRQRATDLFKWLYNYAKQQYGTSFLLTYNLDSQAYEYFADMGDYVDGAYQQNSHFFWDGSGQRIDEFNQSLVRRLFEFLQEQGLQVMNMEHLGTGPVLEELKDVFENYTDVVSRSNLLSLLNWEIETGSTPYVSTVFMYLPYTNGIPRFSRIIDGLPPYTDTPYNDWVIGSSLDDVFMTGDGDDVVYGGPGNDEIYGCSGTDEAYYTGKRADYNVVTDKGITTVTALKSDEGTDVLIGFEGLIFSDSTLKIPYYDISFSDVSESAWFYKAISYITARGISAGPASKNYRPNDKLTRGDFLVMLMKAYGIEPDENPTDNFSDAGNTYYTGYLAAAKRLGLASGVGNNKYAPEDQITRQQLFTLIYRILGMIEKLPEGDSGKTLSDFTDSGQIDAYALDAMKLLVETGTIAGSGGKLNPRGTTTRAEMAQVLYNLLTK